MKILVTGASGMLGSAFCADAIGHEIVGISRAALDVRNPQAVMALSADHRADIVINCAADTNVEGAEDAPDRAYAANTLLPELLAAGCRRSGTVLVQISSAGCYGAWKNIPYVEEDRLDPTTVYHQTKAAGETAVKEQASAWLILRTGWLYGGPLSNPRNFVGRRIQEAQNKAVLLADPSQRGNPTCVTDVVRQTLHLLNAGVRGTFNCVAQASTTRADYVRAIVEAAELPCHVEDAPPGHFVRSAPVSPNEAASNRKLSLLGLDIMPEWRTSLLRYVASLRI